MSANNIRFDLSDRLIHFTRTLDQNLEDSPSEFPIDWKMGEGVEDTKLSPFFLLRRILRDRQILSTRSKRGGRPTIYGPNSAVCFTEMPLAAFLLASRQRFERGENVSPYALLLRKEDLFAAGARPVIYGLSVFAKASDQPDGTRQLPSAVLPIPEQYRYVAFDTQKKGRLDWTHEREWRWPNRNESGFSENDAEGWDNPARKAWERRREEDRADEDGLCLDSGEFSEIGFIVRTEHQARLLVHDILRLVDSHAVDVGVFTFVIVTEVLPPPETLIEVEKTKQVIADATIDVAALAQIPTDSAKLAKSFEQIVKEVVAGSPDLDSEGECGGCWLWLHDNTAPITRALLADERISISRTGKYLVMLPELGDSGGLRVREEATKKIAVAVKEKFATNSSYYSVLVSDDIDGVPSYTDGVFDNDIYINYAHRDDDFK